MFLDKNLCFSHRRKHIYFNTFICSTSYEYELIGVTVHTGNADGGHYYAFIKDRTSVKVRIWLGQSQELAEQQMIALVSVIVGFTKASL